MISHSPSLSGPGLLRMSSRTPIMPRSCNMPAMCTSSTSRRPRSSCCVSRVASSATRAQWLAIAWSRASRAWATSSMVASFKASNSSTRDPNLPFGRELRILSYRFGRDFESLGDIAHQSQPSRRLVKRADHAAAFRQTPEVIDRAERALRDVFRLDAFRPGQAAVVEAMLSGRDVLSVAPTGSGKSISYWVPAVLEGGLTMVVSPLIALMKDQVDRLTERGVPAT